VGTAAVIVALRRSERRLLDRLRAAGATSPERARELPELRFIDERRLQSLKERGVIGEPTPGRYWVDEAAYATLRGDRRWLVWVLLAAALLVAILLNALGGR